MTDFVSDAVETINAWMVENDMEIALAIVDGCMDYVNLSTMIRGYDAPCKTLSLSRCCFDLSFKILFSSNIDALDLQTYQFANISEGCQCVYGENVTVLDSGTFKFNMHC